MRYLVVALLGFALTGLAACGTDAPEPSPTPLYVPDDLTTAFPTSVGGQPVEGQAYEGLAFLEQQKLTYMDTMGGLPAWQAVLAPLEKEPSDVRLALGGVSGIGGSQAVYWVFRVDGMPGSTLLEGLLANSAMYADPAPIDEFLVMDDPEASIWGVADSLAVLGIDPGLRLVDELVIDDKAVVVIDGFTWPSDRNLKHAYVRGEVLYIMESLGPDAPTLAEMLASLP